jgi:phenylalanyl-tRNA synthetase alpha chain
MSIAVLSAQDVGRALSIRDLTDPALGPHAMQLLVDEVQRALHQAWGCDLVLGRRSPIVSIADNYDRLHYPAGGVARDARYTRYVCDAALLRTQTSAMIPPLLSELAVKQPSDALLVCPGIVYRRDSIDRLHTGEPHQIDLWRVRDTAPLGVQDLLQMVDLVVHAALPGRDLRTVATHHPYTNHGLQIDVREGEEWVEVGECGLALPALLRACGCSASVTGLAMGLGLDRILMLRKGVDDIRLLRAPDLRIASQMLDLAPYHPVSSMPPVKRDLSIATDGERTEEELGDRVRSALGSQAEMVERVEVLAATAYEDLPPNAVERLGMSPGQTNVLLRVVLRALDRTLTAEECNLLRDSIYAVLHRGTAHEWATRRR